VEIDNVRAALEWAYAPGGDTTVGAVLTAAFAPVWLDLALLAECREQTERAVRCLAADADLNGRVRLQLYLEYGIVLLLTMGSAETARMVLSEAVEYAEGLGDANAEMRAYWASWVMHSMRGDVHGMRSVAERFASVAHCTADETPILFLDRMIGVSWQFFGRPVEALPRLERVLARLSEPKASDRAFWLWANYDPRVLTATMLARSLWLRGLTDQAANRATTSMKLAEDSGNVFSHCEVLYFAVFPISLHVGDLDTARNALASLIELSNGNNLPMHGIWARSMEATVLVRTGSFAAGMAILNTVLDSGDQSGWSKFQPHFLGVFAEALVGLGRHTQALVVIDKALAKAQATGEGEFLAELFRLKGEFLLEHPGEQASVAAEACYAKALTVSQEQGTLFWRLRVATSLARLRVRQGRSGEARQCLAPVHAQFTEGFKTADLQTATALLDTLE
jgi:predicted ATPase